MSYIDTYTSAIFNEADIVRDIADDDWTIIPLNETSQDLLDDYDGILQFNLGMFGIDLTDFTGYCYEIHDAVGVISYDEMGCPAPILKYYDGFALGMYVDHYDGTYEEIYLYCDEFYGYDNIWYFCPWGMNCAIFYTDSWYYYTYFLEFQGGEAVCDWQTLNNTDFSGCEDYSYFQYQDYPSYGFSRIGWGGTKNFYEDYSDADYWLEENSMDGNLAFWNFKAVHDERIDIGDELTIIVADYDNYETLEQVIELGSGVSLAASAAAVLASATLL